MFCWNSLQIVPLKLWLQGNAPLCRVGSWHPASRRCHLAMRQCCQHEMHFHLWPAYLSQTEVLCSCGISQFSTNMKCQQLRIKLILERPCKNWQFLQDSAEGQHPSSLSLPRTALLEWHVRPFNLDILVHEDLESMKVQVCRHEVEAWSLRDHRRQIFQDFKSAPPNLLVPLLRTQGKICRDQVGDALLHNA